MKNLDNNYFITYSNSFKIGSRLFAFRKKELFEISNLPRYLTIKDNNNCLGYWIDRRFISLARIKDLITNEEVIVDVSSLQWFEQIQLDKVFNL